MKTNTEKAFLKQFKNGCEFWTSEDGTLVSIVIMNQVGWDEILLAQFTHRIRTFDERRATARFVYRSWVGAEYFDGGTGQKRGKVWFLTDEIGPFGVIEYNLAETPKDLGTFTDGDGIKKACRYLGPLASDYDEEWGFARIVYCRYGKKCDGIIRPFEFKRSDVQP